MILMIHLLTNQEIDRDEWVIVGLIGQVQILDGQPTNDRWIKMRDISDTVEEWYIR